MKKTLEIWFLIIFTAALGFMFYKSTNDNKIVDIGNVSINETELEEDFNEIEHDSEIPALYDDFIDFQILLTGEFIFDTFENIEISGNYLGKEAFERTVIKISYNQEEDYFTFFSDIFMQLDIDIESFNFTEPANEDAIYQFFEEKSGYKEVAVYLNNSRIVISHDSVFSSGDGYNVDIRKYIVTFVKN